METSKSASKAGFNGFEVKKFPFGVKMALCRLPIQSSNDGTDLIQVHQRLTLWPIVSRSVYTHKIFIYLGHVD